MLLLVNGSCLREGLVWWGFSISDRGDAVPVRATMPARRVVLTSIIVLVVRDELRALPGGVEVAQRTLDPLTQVRILAGQPKLYAYSYA